MYQTFFIYKRTCLHELHEHVDLVLILERAEELQDEGVRAGGQDVLCCCFFGKWGCESSYIYVNIKGNPEPVPSRS